jgi:RNA polymerase sigma-70 factor, ECF subfamily
VDQIPEAQLIAQGEQGDQTTISDLFGLHYASSLGLATPNSALVDEAQDVVQTAYCSAFQHLSSFRGEASFKTWINRIVVNCCLMQLRRRRRRVGWVSLEDLRGGLGSDRLASPAPTPEKAAWFLGITSAFTDATSKLPKQLCEVYTLHSICGPIREGSRDEPGTHAFRSEDSGISSERRSAIASSECDRAPSPLVPLGKPMRVLNCVVRN